MFEPLAQIKMLANNYVRTKLRLLKKFSRTGSSLMVPVVIQRRALLVNLTVSKRPKRKYGRILVIRMASRGNIEQE